RWKTCPASAPPSWPRSISWYPGSDLRSGRAFDLVPRRLVEVPEHVEGLEVLHQLLRARGAEHHRGHVRVAQAPGDRQRCRRDPEFLRHVGEAARALDAALLRVADHHLLQPAESLPREPAFLLHAAVVLAGEQPGGERRPDGG